MSLLWFVMLELYIQICCLTVLVGDTASRTSLPGGEDETFVDDGTTSRSEPEQYQ